MSKERPEKTEIKSKAEIVQAAAKKGLGAVYLGIPYYWRWLFYIVTIGLILIWKLVLHPAGPSGDLSDPKAFQNSKPDAAKTDFKERKTPSKSNPPEAGMSNPLRRIFALDRGAERFIFSLRLPLKLENVPEDAPDRAQFVSNWFEETLRKEKDLLDFTLFVSFDPLSPALRKVLEEKAGALGYKILVSNETPSSEEMEKLNKFLVVHVLSDKTLKGCAESMWRLAYPCLGCLNKNPAASVPGEMALTRCSMAVDAVEATLKNVKDKKRVLLVGKIVSRDPAQIQAVAPSPMAKLILESLKIEAVSPETAGQMITPETAQTLKLDGYIFLLSEKNLTDDNRLPKAFQSEALAQKRDDLEYPGLSLAETLLSIGGQFRPDKINTEFSDQLTARVNQFRPFFEK